MYTRAQARKSYITNVEDPTAGPSGATQLVRPTLEEAVGKPESSPAGPVVSTSDPSPISMVITTSEGGLGISGPVDFFFPGIFLGCPGGQAGPTSTEWSPRPPSERGRVHPLGWPLKTIYTKRPRQTVT